MNTEYWTSMLVEQIQPQCEPIPPGLRADFAPAVGCLYEWRDYWLEYPDADTLKAGTESCLSPRPGLFNLRFENQLGLAALQPFVNDRPLAPPYYVEVISPKRPSPAAHLRFYRTLLDDLFARAARLPFTFGGPTARSVLETLRPPTPLFTLHFLHHFAPALGAAIAVIQAAPHRKLRDFPDLVPLAKVVEADADVLLSIVHSPERWVPARGFALAQRLKYHAPAHVWQRCPEETSNTPENRFVRHFFQQLLTAAEALPAQRWWANVPSTRQATVREVTALLRHTIVQPPLANVSLLHQLPLNSQVLLRRDGYREVLDLWQRFQYARRPLFAPLQQALEVRDIATLYEFWCFFKLADDIRKTLRVEPALHLIVSDAYGLQWRSEARFGKLGRLLYNHTYCWPNSYSVPLRPDFAWVVEDKLQVVLDAKFRLQWLDSAQKANKEKIPNATAKRSDIDKMHAYRDALGIRAAVAVYPGDQTLFYDVRCGRYDTLTLNALLNGDLSGVGAMPLKPG
ncbi:MAG: DUF2357 domain-containing protein [Chloroflexi bacterium]|nr:DUF2357 domain-containing protein [Chloroflexota bacterium]